MSDVELEALRQGIQTLPGRPLGSASEQTSRLTQVISTQGLLTSPPTLTVGDPTNPTEMRVVGNIWDYHPGDTVIYQSRDGMPIVVGRLSNVGTETDPLEEDYPPWHTVGAAGEPAFQGTFTNFGGAHAVAGFYMQSDGWVRLKGLLAGGGGAAGANIFDLPSGWAPPFSCYFTVSTGSPQAGAVIHVSSSGTVEAQVAYTTTWLSLAGITFPSSWVLSTDQDTKFHRGHWFVPIMQSGWNKGSQTDAEIEFFLRSDGWVWCKGVLETGTVPGKALDIPDRCAPGWRTLMNVGFGFGSSRHDIGGGDPASNRGPTTWRVESGGGSGQDHYIGGQNWFGYGAQLREYMIEGAAFSFVNGWTNFGSDFHQCRYFKDAHGIVHLMGLAQGSASTADTIATLPVGFRPAEQHLFNGIITSNGQGRIDVEPDGDIVATGHPNNGFASLDGCTFRAEQ